MSKKHIDREVVFNANFARKTFKAIKPDVEAKSFERDRGMMKLNIFIVMWWEKIWYQQLKATLQSIFFWIYVTLVLTRHSTGNVYCFYFDIFGWTHGIQYLVLNNCDNRSCRACASEIEWSHEMSRLIYGKYDPNMNSWITAMLSWWLFVTSLPWPSRH